MSSLLRPERQGEVYVLSIHLHPMRVAATDSIARAAAGPVGFVNGGNDAGVLPRLAVVKRAAVVEGVVSVVLLSLLPEI